MTTRSKATTASCPLDRSVRRIPEREIAIALVLEYAETNCINFGLMGFYDDDCEFLDGLADRLEVPQNVAFRNKLTRVVRRLVNYGVLHGRMRGTAKEYIDEPAKQMSYWLKNGKADLIRRGKTHCTNEPEWEAAFLLRHAYPEPETPNVEVRRASRLAGEASGREAATSTAG